MILYELVYGNRSRFLQTSPNHVWLTSRDRSSPWNSWCPIFPHSSGQHTSPCWTSGCNSILSSRILIPSFPWKNVSPNPPNFSDVSHRFASKLPELTLLCRRHALTTASKCRPRHPVAPSATVKPINQPLGFFTHQATVRVSNLPTIDTLIRFSSYIMPPCPNKICLMADIISRDSRALADCADCWCQTSVLGIFQIHLIPVDKGEVFVYWRSLKCDRTCILKGSPSWYFTDMASGFAPS